MVIHSPGVGCHSPARLILTYFRGNRPQPGPDYKCGCCDVCRDSLDFDAEAPEPRENPTIAAYDRQLQELLLGNQFELERVRNVAQELKERGYGEYALLTAQRRLESSANNLAALFLRWFYSPSDGSAVELVRTANRSSVGLAVVQRLFSDLADEHKPQVLPTLNDMTYACDSQDGWEFMAREAGRLRRDKNDKFDLLQTCFEFGVAAEGDYDVQVRSIRENTGRLKEAFDA